MGVAGLWDILKPAAKIRSLTELAVTEGFNANPHGLRGYRIGVDASIWFFHAEYGKEGENPVLRTLFFRCAALMKMPFLPLFVFDGPKRPEFKRGKRINKTGNKLIPGMKRIVEAFGFEWRMAPGEAEAELAYLNRIGVIDGILSDDVDNFLFGALTVIRNQSNNLSGNKLNPVLNSQGKDDKNHTRVFRFRDIYEHSDIQLTRGGLILVGLMSGGDYEGGLERCGIATAHAIARCGFGDTLFDAARDLSREGLINFAHNWRQEVQHELRTNSRKFMTRKAITLAQSIPDTFPNIDVLLSYVNPVTSESLGHEGTNPTITWSKEPDIAALAGACELFFEWGYKDAIIKRFRTVIWPGAVLRTLRRAVLDVDGHSTSSTEYKTKQNPLDSNEGNGTPSKIIAKHLSAVNLNDNDDEKTEIEQTENCRIIVGISRERTHVSTDGLPEYRLEVAPAQLVNTAISGLQGLRQPEGPNGWASDEDEVNDEDEGLECSKKGKAKEPVDPTSLVRLWMPGCMVDLAEKGLVGDFRDVRERRKQKKAPVKKQTRERPEQVLPIPRKGPPTKHGKHESEEVPVSSPNKTQSITTTSGRTTSVPKSCFAANGNLSPQTPSRKIPQPFPLECKASEESSGDEGELPTIPIPPSIDQAETAPTKKPFTQANALSKTTQVAAIFSTSATTIPSARTIEETLALTDSDDELPTGIYRSIRPKKLSKPVAFTGTAEYLSLSDSESSCTILTSHVKQKKQTRKKQTTLSAYIGPGARKISADSQNEKPNIPPPTKPPRKSRFHAFPRDKGATDKAAKEGSPVIEVSDESDGGYSGVSRPALAPLHLARHRAKAHLISSRPQPSSATCDVIDLT